MITLPATSDLGTGLTLPIAKAIGHLHLAWTALDMQWADLTAEQLHAELVEANQHLAVALHPENLLTEQANTAITNHRTALGQRITELTRSITPNPDTKATDLPDDIKAQIREIIPATWALLTTLDRELTGLTEAQTDPGRMP